MQCRLSIIGCLIGLCLTLSTQGHAESPYVPPQLAPWVDWVLEDHDNLRCPRQADTGAPADCVWISRLSLVVDEAARFEMTVQAYNEARVPLPGDGNSLPGNMRVNGKPATVIGGHTPAVLLQSGNHQLSGTIRWSKRPGSITIPVQHGMLRLEIDGEAVRRPTLKGNRLTLNQRSTPPEASERDSLSVDVKRLLTDGYPLTLRTHVTLDVSGTPRMVRLGTALPDGFVLTAFESDMSARLNGDGTLQAQITPGVHEVRFDARGLGDPSAFAIAPTTEDWPEQEIWGFEPNNRYRLAEVTGGSPVDLNQVDWPFDVNMTQGFLLGSDDRLTIEEKQRGNPEGPAHRTSVNRDLWLGFNGDRWVVLDQLHTEIFRPVRLQSQLTLGRVSVDEQPTIVSTLKDTDAGIQLTTGTHAIEAVSALHRAQALHATGWRFDAQALQATLHLPPGWRLLWAGGVDQAKGSWLDRWTLWHIFLGVLLIVTAARFVSYGFAAIATVAAILALPDSVGVVLCWLVATGLVGLTLRIDSPRFTGLVKALALGWLGITLIPTFSMAVSSLQEALYPQLETRQSTQHPLMGAAMDAEMAAVESAIPMASKARSLSYAEIEEVVVTASKARNKYPEDMAVQTGPGTPQWQWRSHRLSWSGPVNASQLLDLKLVSPLWVRIGNILLAGAAFALIGLLALQVVPKGRRFLPAPFKADVPLILLASALLLGSDDSHAQSALPDRQLLEALEQRLTRAPACFPDCAQLERAELHIDENRLTVTLQINTDHLISYPLPESSSWQASAITDNSATAVLRREKGQLHAALEAGRHTLRMTGPVSHLNQFDLRLPKQPATGAADASDGWQLSGITDTQSLSGNVYFRRTSQRDAQKETHLQQDPAPAFVDVHRQITFGLDWRVLTTVSRLAPRSGNFAVRVPLVTGERVLDTPFDIKDGDMLVRFGQRDRRHQWESRLPTGSNLTLQAEERATQRERWTLVPSDFWHVETSGLATQSVDGSEGEDYAPRNGESLSVTASPARAVEGASVTVERVKHDVEPGVRTEAHELELTLRAGQGGTYTLTLPDQNPELQSVTIQGDDTPVRLQGNKLALPIYPGELDYVVQWRTDRPITLHYRVSHPVFDSPVNNLTTTLAVPANRWIIFLGGPQLGPAMLYWGLAGAALIIALALSRLPESLLRTRDALLLAAGLSLCNLPGALLFAIWLAFMSGRQAVLAKVKNHRLKNFLQIAAWILTGLALIGLIASVPMALLSAPDMFIEGNGSWARSLHWYLDHAGADGGEAGWLISLPMWVYRLAMLLWSLWLAIALLRWGRETWARFCSGPAWFPAPSPSDEK